MIEKITEHTLVPIGILVAISSSIFGLGIIYADIKDHDKALAKLEEKQDNYYKDVNGIYKEIAEIKGELKRMNQ